MGQRSQIYVRATLENGETELLARYYQWNFGERMISRARGGIEHIETCMDDFSWNNAWEREKMARILDVNFDMRDIVMSSDIIKEHHEFGEGLSFREDVFEGQDNNDGKLFIDVDIKNKTIKYAFLDYKASLDNIMDAEQYMKWDSVYGDDKNGTWRDNLAKNATGDLEEGKEIVRICEDNIKAIGEMATLMTRKELENFLSSNYEKDKTKTTKANAKNNIEKE